MSTAPTSSEITGSRKAAAGVTTPLRILHLASSERWTGPAEPATTLALQQQAAGHAVSFACMAGFSFERRVHELGLPYAQGFLLNRSLKLGNLRADIRKLREYVRREQPDIVHCHLPHDHWLAALALRGPGSRAFVRSATPIIVRTLHRAKSLRGGLVNRWLAGKGTDLWLTVSDADCRAVVEGIGVPTPKVVFVRGSVDLERFRPGLDGSAVRTEANVDPEAPLAGLVARMQPGRGHDVFIDAAASVAKAIPAARLLMAGRGELKRELLARIEQHENADALRRLGYRKDDLPETYAALDVGVLLVPGSDGSCRAMLEAMACGRAVIGSRIGAIAETIEPGVSGWLVEPGSADSLAHALIEALSNRERTRAMGEAARLRVETNHSREGQSRATLEAYAAALKRRSDKLGVRIS